MVTFKNNSIVADVENLDLFISSIADALSTINYQIVKYRNDALFCKDDFYKNSIDNLQMMYNFLFEIYHVCFVDKEDF